MTSTQMGKEQSSSPNQDLYLQALQDFGVIQLLESLSTLSKVSGDSLSVLLYPEEICSLAALLIKRLTTSLNSELICSLVNTVQQSNDISDLPIIHVDTLAPSISLPDEFPDGATTPLFLYGDRVRLQPLSKEDETDTGVVIGRFYVYASERCQWAWKYLIWLDSESCSAQFCAADTAWEEHLEPFIQEEAL